RRGPEIRARARDPAPHGRTVSQLAVWNCKQLVTLAGPARPRVRAEMRELAVIPDGAMLVRDGLVEATGTRAEIERRISAGAEIVDAGGGVVLPGAGEADFGEPAGRGRVWFARGGTTTIEAKSGYGLSVEAELRILRVVRDLAA